VKTLVIKERGHHGFRVQGVVRHKFSQGQEVDPVVLLVIDQHLKILLQDLIYLFI